MLRRTFFATLASLAFAGTALAQTPAQPQAPVTAAPVVTPAPKIFLTTSMGEIEITLDPVGAPKTSAHMLKMFQTTHFIGASFFHIAYKVIIAINLDHLPTQKIFFPGSRVVSTFLFRYSNGEIAGISE